MRHLLDVNLLVALAWPNHVHHRSARAWFGREQPAWASTPMSQCGFVRISSNPRAVPTAVSPEQAIAMLAGMLGTGDHLFMADAVELVGHPHVEPARLTGHRTVTDAHLLAVARRHGAVLATFDRGCLGLLAAGEGDVVVVPA